MSFSLAQIARRPITRPPVVARVEVDDLTALADACRTRWPSWPGEWTPGRTLSTVTRPVLSPCPTSRLEDRTAWVCRCRQSSPCPTPCRTPRVRCPTPSQALSRIAAAMRRHGHTVTDRTGLRWRDRAVNHLATELNRDLSDASNDEVQLAVTAV